MSARTSLACLLSLGLIWSSSTAYAGGYYSGTKGARAAGRSGAFAAKADDLSAAAFNPAGFARLDSNLIQVGNRFSYNANSFARTPTLDFGGGGTPTYVEFERVHNEKPWQLLEPILGVATNLGLRDWGFAFAIYAPAGISREDFPLNGGQRYMMVHREAIILNYTLNAAYQLGDQFSVGASLQWISVPKLDYQLVIDANQFPRTVNPVSSEVDMLATVSGSDLFTLNAVLGAWYRPVPCIEIGVSGQVIPTQIKTNSTLSIRPLNTEIDSTVDIRRNGEQADDVHVLLPLPLTARMGVRYRHLRGAEEIFDVELDVSYETWSRVERFTVDGDGLVAELYGQRVDVGRIEIEKQWLDTVTVQLGGDYALMPDAVVLRSGVFFESAVAQDAYANVDFAGGPQVGGALGSSVFLGPLELAVAYEFRRQLDVELTEGQGHVYQEVPSSPCDAPYTDPNTCHDQYLGQRAATVNGGRYRAFSHAASLDVLYRF